MAAMGCSPIFYRTLAFDPNKLNDLLKLSPSNLAATILDITGDKILAENLAKHRAALQKTREKLYGMRDTLRAKEEEVASLRRQRAQVDAHEQQVADAAAFGAAQARAQYLQAMARYTEEKERRDRLTDEGKAVTQAVSDRQQEEADTSRALQQATAALEAAKAEVRARNAAWHDATAAVAQIRGRAQQYRELISAAEGIEGTAESLAEAASREEDAASDARHELRRLQQQRQELEHELRRAEGGDLYPIRVAQFLEQCGRRGIQPKVVADAIEFHDPRWQLAVESILGNNRFSLVVQPHELDPMFDLAEKHRYRSWVNTPYTGSVPKPRPGSIMTQVVLTDPSVYRFVRMLDQYEMAENKEEAKRIAARGGQAITPTGMIWNENGFRSIATEALYCGKETRRRRIAELKQQISVLTAELRAVQQKAASHAAAGKALRQQSETLRAAQEAQARLAAIEAELQEAESREAAAAEVARAAEDERDRQAERQREAERLYEAAGRALREAKSSYQGFMTNMARVRADYDQAAQALASARERALQFLNDQDELAFAQEDLDRFLAQRSDIPEGADILAWLGFKHQSLLQEIDRLERNVKPHINYPLLKTLDHKERQLDEIQRTHDNVEEELEAAARQLEETRSAHRLSVQRTLSRYLEELEGLASRLPGCTTEGSKAVPIGDDHWELHVKIGFDGKAAIPYNHRNLSGGQRAATSVMLLMAALKLDGGFSVMFLDEPTARLDDQRSEELGDLLRASGAQIFVTAPTSASLLSMSWLDQTIHTTKKVPGQQFAPAVKVRILRKRGA